MKLENVIGVGGEHILKQDSQSEVSKLPILFQTIVDIYRTEEMNVAAWEISESVI